MKNLKAKAPVSIVVNDNGYAAHKITFLDQGRIQGEKYPTSIQSGRAGLSDVDGKNEDIYTVEVGEVVQAFTCSSAVTEPLDLRNDQYPFSEANRVLTHHALHRTGHSGARVVLGITLPFRDYYKNDGTQNSETQKRAIENFETNNVASHNGSRVEVVKAFVFPEAFCAFYDWGLGDQGEPLERMNEIAEGEGSVLVVDIGGSTTDIVSVRFPGGDVRLDHKHSGTKKVGVLNVRERLTGAYQNRSGGGHEHVLSNSRAERLLATGQLKVGSHVEDFKAERASAIREVTGDILNYMLTTAGSLSQYDVIIVVGGGAILFKEELTKMLPHAVISDEFANSRGALKYMLASQLATPFLEG